MDFTSDNASGAAPEIVAAIADAAKGHAASYGDDAWTRRLQTRFSELFEREVLVLPVVTGTAANAIALASVTPPYGAIFCHNRSHIAEDECGAVEQASGGARLVLLEGAHGKIAPATFERALARHDQGDVHRVQAAALSLTQATESGTIYTPDEMRALAAIAKSRNLAVHVDGARFANALAALGVSPAEATWKAGVDILSFGATKNGAIGAEAIVIFDADRAGDIARRRMRAGHLLSKMRFVSAQLLAYVEDGLWLRLAAHANAMARRLADGLAGLPGVTLDNKIAINEVFVHMPKAMEKRLRAAGARFHPWPAEPSESHRLVRLVAAFSTEAEDVDAFLTIAAEKR